MGSLNATPLLSRSQGLERSPVMPHCGKSLPGAQGDRGRKATGGGIRGVPSGAGGGTGILGAGPPVTPPTSRHRLRRDAPPPLRHRFGDHGDDGASLSKGMPPPCHSRREGRRPREGAAHRGQVRRSEFDLTGSGMASGSGVPSEETARRPRGPVEDVVTGMDRLYLLPNRRKGRLAKDSELRTQLKWLHNRRPLLPNDLTAGSAKLAASSAKLSMLQNRSYPLPACRVLLHNSPAKLPIILDMMHNLASGWRGEHDMQHFKVGTQHRDSGERLRSPGERLREES